MSGGRADVKTIHTILREDFGRLDRNLIRTELLAEKGIRDVAYEHARNRLTIQYDPKVMSDQKLLDIMCRYGVFPEGSVDTDDDSGRADA
jgi:hypothetical protein